MEATATITTMLAKTITMANEQCHFPTLALLRLQSWLSPAFSTGAYSYSHAVEWAVEAGHIKDRKSLVDWLEADLCYGSGRNEAIFFLQAWLRAKEDDREKLLEVVQLAAAFRGTSEFALEASQQGTACLNTLRQVWPDPLLDWLSETIQQHHIKAVLAVVLAVGAAKQCIPSSVALPAFLQSYIANLVTAGVRLVPLGQTDGQLAIAELEPSVLWATAEAEKATLEDLRSAAFLLDIASMAHETQYTRLFRS